MQQPYGLQLYAFEHRCDITDPCFATTYECALEDLFGAEADALCAERQLLVDAATRAKLVEQIGRRADKHFVPEHVAQARERAAHRRLAQADAPPHLDDVALGAKGVERLQQAEVETG